MKKALYLAGALFALAACVKENGQDMPGRDITFGAKAPVSTITKTAYSYHQETVESQLMERIDWENEDMIRILCDQVSSSPKYFDYDITLSENENIKSYAAADPHGAEHGLQWGTGTHTFFSLYPSPTTSGAQSGIDIELTGGSTARASAVLPANQSASVKPITLDDNSTAQYYGDMKLAYMTAAQQATEGSNVTLSFKPMVTTFFVTVANTTGGKMTLQKVALTSSSTALTGTYRISMDQNNNRPGSYQYNVSGNWEDAVSRTDENSSIYALFNDVEIPATGNNSITVALFALPQNITNLTLTVEAVETGPVSLPLKYNGEFITFAGEKKHNINNINVPGVTYALDVSPTTITYDYQGTYTTATNAQEFTVTSYKSIGGSQRDTPWQTEIWIDANGDGVKDDSEWTPLSEVITDDEYSWLSSFPTSSSASADADEDSNTATHTFRKSVSAQNVVSHEERLKRGKVLLSSADASVPLFPTEQEAVTYSASYVDNSTDGNAVDLSMYNFENHRMESVRYTANTYIISAPGYYKIPLVFGNAMENGARQPASFSGRAARLGHLDEFICPYPNKSGTESSIHLVSTRPWLNARRSASARMHWEKYSYWDKGTSTVKTSTRSWSDAANDPEVIKNISIVTGAVDERYIVFEVDKDNIRPGNVLMGSLDSYSNVQWSWQIWITDQDMKPITVNNGTRTYSVMPVNLGWTDLEKGLHYEPREAVLRFASTEKAGLYSSHLLTVKQTGTDLTSKNGWSTFYQWGRKDPLTDGLVNQYTNDGYLHESIKHPSNIMQDKSSFFGDRYYDWTIHNYSNLWDSKNTDYDSPSSDLPNHKTVYDPSPRRYCVPPDATWDGFTSYSDASSEGVYFPTGVGENTIFFPTAGFMSFTAAASSHGDNINNGYWTYHPGEGTQRRASYCLQFKYNNASSTVNIKTKSYKDIDDDSDYVSRAYGFSVRPIAYDESAVVSTSDGTMSNVFNFEDMWGDGTSLGSYASNMNGYSTTYPSSSDNSSHEHDITLSFTSERSTSRKNISYAYDSDNQSYSLVLPDSYTALITPNYNKFKVEAASGLKIVQIVLTVAHRSVNLLGNTDIAITTDNPTFSDDTWVGEDAAYNETTKVWSGGQQSVEFTMGTGTDPWKITAITVNYYETATP